MCAVPSHVCPACVHGCAGGLPPSSPSSCCLWASYSLPFAFPVWSLPGTHVCLELDAVSRGELLMFNTCCLGSLPTAPRPTCKVSGQSCAPDFSPAVLLPPSSLARLPTLPRGWAETSFQCPGTQVLRGGSICGPHIPSPLLHQLSPVGSHSSVCPRGDVWPSSTHFAYSLVYNEVLILLILLVENT